MSPERPGGATVLFVSKPVEPPWNDSSKNLVRDVATHLSRHRARVVVRRGSGAPPRTVGVPLHPPGAGGYAPALRENARVLARLLAGPRAALWHFFFAPNPRSGAAGRLAAKLRRVPTVHTVCSAPRPGVDLGRSLFADRTVVLSAHTEARLREAGCRGLVRIPPSVPALPPMDARARDAARERFGLPGEAPVVAYPGDLEFGGGAERMIEALGELPAEAILVMACRRKTDAAAAVEARLRARGEALAPGRVRWVGETDAIHALLGAADVVALPSDDLWAKMDHPLVLLEAMSLERPVVVAAGTPAAELAEGGAARAVEPDAGAVAEAVGALLEDAEAARALGERGRARVLAVHAPARVAAAYERVYDGLLERTER